MKDQGKYQALTYYQLMEVSLRELLVEKGLVTEQQVANAVEDMRSRTPERGARVVAHAWTHPQYKTRLLENVTEPLATCSRPWVNGCATVPETVTSTVTSPEDLKSALKLSMSFRLTRPCARKSSWRSPLNCTVPAASRSVPSPVKRNS